MKQKEKLKSAKNQKTSEFVKKWGGSVTLKPLGTSPRDEYLKKKYKLK